MLFNFRSHQPKSALPDSNKRDYSFPPPDRVWTLCEQVIALVNFTAAGEEVGSSKSSVFRSLCQRILWYESLVSREKPTRHLTEPHMTSLNKNLQWISQRGNAGLGVTTLVLFTGFVMPEGLICAQTNEQGQS